MTHNEMYAYKMTKMNAHRLFAIQEMTEDEMLALKVTVDQMSVSKVSLEKTFVHKMPVD
jgi:hypothetical protein